MATKKVAQTRPRTSGPASESRLKVAHAQPSPPRFNTALHDAEGHIVDLRKHVADLWWYGDHSALGDSGTTPESAREQMANAAREIGMLLNLLDCSVRELAADQKAEAAE